jgi:hypothetical protein
VRSTPGRMLLRSTEHHVCCTFGAERVVCGVYLYPGEGVLRADRVWTVGEYCVLRFERGTALSVGLSVLQV